MERGMIFQGWGMRGVMADEKTQTRRMAGLKKINESPDDWELHTLNGDTGNAVFEKKDGISVELVKSRYGGVGDIIYPKETFKIEPMSDCSYGNAMMLRKLRVTYKADGAFKDFEDGGCYSIPNGVICEASELAQYVNLDYLGVWRSPLIMPRIASRADLLITDLRLERVQDISEDNAVAEGVKPQWYGSRLIPAPVYFQETWDRINAKRGFGWDKNPWTFVYEFKKTA